MSITIATEMNYLEQKDDELDKILAQKVQEGDVNARNRRRKDRKQNSIEVTNPEVDKLIESLTKLKYKVNDLNYYISEILKFDDKIAQKIPVVQDIQRDNEANQKLKKETTNRDEKLQLIKQKIDFRQVEDLFDDIVDEQLHGGVFFSTINILMVIVMCVSGYLWMQLSKLEAR